LNRIQKAALVIGALILTVLLLYPPWQEAALREVDYRKNIGRGLVFRPPGPVAVECYFVGCQTAPPSYFHVVLYSELLTAQCATAVFVTLSLVWIFRSSKSGIQTALQKPRTRLIFSTVIALAIPPLGDFPFASMLVDLPGAIVHHDELWLLPVLLTVISFVFCTGVVYGLVTLISWFKETRSHERLLV
jgi:hypothetical protein